MASSYAVEQWRRLREGRHGPGDGSGGWVRVTRPAALGADGEAPRRSAALGLLLGLRRRAVLAVLLLGRGVRRADDRHGDARGEDGQDRRDDKLDEEEPVCSARVPASFDSSGRRGRTPMTNGLRRSPDYGASAEPF